jgi:hypothetical protein
MMKREAYIMRPVRGSRVCPIESRRRCKLSFSSVWRATSGAKVSCRTVAISWKPYRRISGFKWGKIVKIG